MAPTVFVCVALAMLGAIVILSAAIAGSRRHRENRNLVSAGLIAADRIRTLEGELEFLRSERVELHEEQTETAELVGAVGRSLAIFERRLEGVGRDALKAAEGSTRVEERLLGFTRRIANPQSRGTFGERALENQLETLGLVEGRDYERQVIEIDGRRRLDFVVRLGPLEVAIDSKLAMDHELIRPSSTDRDERGLRDLGEKLVRHANELAGREYWRALKRSPTFVLMYVPIEGAAEALRAVPDFSPEKFAAERAVYIVSPLQLGTVLGVISELAHSARRGEELADLVRDLSDLDRELARLCDLLARESRQIGAVIGTHRQLQSALGPRGGVGRMARKVRGFSRRSGELPAFKELDDAAVRDELAAGYRDSEKSDPTGT